MASRVLPSNSIEQGVSRTFSLYMELSKSRLTGLVLVTTLAGYWAACDGVFSFWVLFWTMVGTAGAAASANSLNQWLEVDLDGLMRRTRNRPLPSGKLSERRALAWSLGSGALGVTVLALFVNGLTALLGAANIAIYVLIYTPLKRRSSLCTLVGAVCGAIPPMMGWTAARGDLSAGAWVLGAILFVWQIPHFLSLAWMYKDDYSRGGFKMLPLHDERGLMTTRVTVLYSLALAPVAAAAFLCGLGGWLYLIGALSLGGAMFLYSLQFARACSYQSARKVFFASLLYLPLLLGLMAIDGSPAFLSNKPRVIVNASSIENELQTALAPDPETFQTSASIVE